MEQKTRTHEQILETRRSNVRVVVTYLAAAFIFAGGIIVLISGWFEAVTENKLEEVKDIYQTILPIATTVVTYWFASRKPKENNEDTVDTKNEKTDPATQKPSLKPQEEQ